MTNEQPNPVTPSVGEVVPKVGGGTWNIEKIPKRPDMWVCVYWAPGPKEWCGFEPTPIEAVAKQNARYCKRRGMKSEIVHIPGTEVKGE